LLLGGSPGMPCDTLDAEIKGARISAAVMFIM
jgi:hypothetical protein